MALRKPGIPCRPSFFLISVVLAKGSGTVFCVAGGPAGGGGGGHHVCRSQRGTGAGGGIRCRHRGWRCSGATALSSVGHRDAAARRHMFRRGAVPACCWGLALRLDVVQPHGPAERKPRRKAGGRVPNGWQKWMPAVEECRWPERLLQPPVIVPRAPLGGLQAWQSPTASPGFRLS